MKKRATIFMAFIFAGFIVLMAAPFVLSELEFKANPTVRKGMLQYYQEKFPRRIGQFTNNKGERYLLRIQSIDGGRSWLLLKKEERVRCYLKDMFPELDPMRDFRPVE